jgi:hypothetical protein
MGCFYSSNLCLDCIGNYCYKCSDRAKNIQGKCYLTDCSKFGYCLYCSDEFCEGFKSDEYYNQTSYCFYPIKKKKNWILLIYF